MSFLILKPYYYANKPTCPRCGHILNKPRYEEKFNCEVCDLYIVWSDPPRKEQTYARSKRFV